MATCGDEGDDNTDAGGDGDGDDGGGDGDNKDGGDDGGRLVSE